MAHAKNIGEPFMAHAKDLYNIPCRHGQYSQKWRLPAFTGIYKYFIDFSLNYIVDSPSYSLYYTWTP